MKDIFSAHVGLSVFGLRKELPRTQAVTVFADNIYNILNPYVTPQVSIPRDTGSIYLPYPLDHFLRELVAQKRTPWEALVSRTGVIGIEAQARLFEIAKEFFLQPSEMVSAAGDDAFEALEKREKGFAPTAYCIRSLARYLFSQNLASKKYLFPYDLEDYRDRLQALLDNWNLDEAYSIYEEIKWRPIRFRDPGKGYTETYTRVIREYYDQFVLS